MGEDRKCKAWSTGVQVISRFSSRENREIDQVDIDKEFVGEMHALVINEDSIGGIFPPMKTLSLR